MASNTYRNSSRRPPPKNARNFQSDRKKMKNDGPNFWGKQSQSFHQPDDVNNDAKQYSKGSSNLEKVLDCGSNMNGPYKESPNNCRSTSYQNHTFHPKTKQFNGYPISEPKAVDSGYYSGKSSSCSERSVRGFGKPHSKFFPPRPRHSEKPSFRNQQVEDPCCSNNEVLHVYNQGARALGVPIKPPMPKCSSSSICLPNVQHQEEQSWVPNDLPPLPPRFDSHDSYMNQPHHKRGTGLYCNEFQDLPPRFQNAVARERQEAEQILQEAKRIKEQYLNLQQAALSANTCPVTTVHVKPDNEVQNVTNKDTEPCQRSAVTTVSAKPDHNKRNAVHERAVSYQQNAVTTVSTKPDNNRRNAIDECAYQSTTLQNTNSHFQKNRGYQNNRCNSTGHGAKDTHFKRNESKASSLGRSEWKGSPTPAFKKFEQHLSGYRQEEDKEKRTLCSEQRSYHRLDRYPKASHPQEGNNGIGVKGHGGGNVATFQEESQEHYNCKPSTDERVRRKGTPSAFVQSDHGVQLKKEQAGPFNSQDHRSSRFNNHFNSEKGAIGNDTENSVQMHDIKVNEPNSENSPRENRDHGVQLKKEQAGSFNSQDCRSSRFNGHFNSEKNAIGEARVNCVQMHDIKVNEPNSENSPRKNRDHGVQLKKEQAGSFNSQDHRNSRFNSRFNSEKGAIGEDRENSVQMRDIKVSEPNSENSPRKNRDHGVQLKKEQTGSFNSQDCRSSRFSSHFNSEKNAIGEARVNCVQMHDIKVNEPNSENSPRKNREKRLSCSSDGQLSASGKQSANNRTSLKNLVKVKVSSDVGKLGYWESFLKAAIPDYKFEVKVDNAVAEMLSITFSEESDAKQARIILGGMRRKSDGKPYIKTVKPPRYFKNMVNRSLGILNGCLRDIDKLYTRVVSTHDEKIALRKKELDLAKKESHVQESIMAAKAKLDELEEMRDVFSRYTGKKRDEMNAEVKKQEVDVGVVSRNLLQLKKDFIREYNCVKGGLPIYAKKEVILDIVHRNQVSVLVAETGSGKSTQVVQYLLQDGLNKGGIIVCTQPRKIAAVSIAKYISGQMGSPVGATVGYEVGLDKKTSRKTRIVYMTDYVLLKKCVYNKNLEGITCVVIDEAHERSLFTDLLLGIIKRCLPSRPDIRIIITSATIDPGVFQDYFSLSSAAILTVPGRTYPVKIEWQETDAQDGWNYLEGCVRCAHKVHNESAFGDILVFLTSPQETDEAVNLFKQTTPTRGNKASPILFSLHGKQDINDQINVFSPTPKGCRKIIFATNAAETSITIPGIKFVIDSGMVKEKQYIAEKNRSALVVRFISKSSAEQRMGRAGRTQAGVCYRMYSKENYKDMPDRVTPEILRINLQLALLKIMEFKVQPEDFEFVETPPKESIASALHSLEFLGAVKDKCFTDLGKKITRLPLEPQLGKLVIVGAAENVGYETAIVASIATVSGMVFYRNEANKEMADEKKMKFCKEEGDFLTFLDVFKQWYDTPPERKPQWCAENCINAKAMRIAYQTTEELIQTMRHELRIHVRKGFQPLDVFDSKCERILFECFSENVCVFSGHKKTGYLSPFEPGSFFVHPSSSLCYLNSKFDNYLIFSSVLKTSRTFLLNVTPIQESTIISAYQKGTFPYQIDMLKHLQILPARIYPVGESILIREVLGKQGSKVHGIEEQIRLFTKSDAFYVEVNVEKGEILIYIEQQHHGIVSKLLNTIIQEAQCYMAKEEDIFRIAECASSCFAVGSGGIVSDILLPGEFREVVVEGYRKLPSVDKVISRLKDFGVLQSSQEVEEHGNPQILATYVRAVDAQKAVEQLQKLKLFDISSKVSYAKLSDKSLPLFRLQVTWPRFPCLGTGWISFQTFTECIEASGILTNNSFYIGDHYILFTPAKKSEKELEMKNLPSYVEPQDVKSALKKHLPGYLEVKNVNLVRAKSYRASETEMNSIKKQLYQMFSQYTPSSKLVVDLKSPNAYEISWTALVYFENFEDGEQALKGLKDKAKIGEHKLHIKLILKSSLHCDLEIFKMVEKNLHVLMAYSKNQGICTEFDIKPASAKKSVLITFSCSDIKNLNKVRQEIRKLIHGTTLPCSDKTMYSKLFSKSGEEYIKGIQQTTGTMISTNSFRKTVTIFGLEKAVSSAKSHISCYISTTNDEQVRVFNLCGKRIPCGFLKALRQQYGFKLLGLIEKFGLRAADIDFVNRQLTVKCSEKVMTMVEQCLADLCREVKKSSAKNLSSDQESCPVCMDIITSDLYRLNHCGHAFCRQCLLLQMESKIIPLVCAKEGCEKPLFVEDINKLLFGNEELRKEFSQAALKHFISKSSAVHYCPVPDCSMVYRVTSQGEEFHCPSCENDICTRCHAFYHHGMTCEMFQKCRVDADYPLKLWIMQDPENRKQCPKCSAAIEKVGGCNHVLCSHCDTHLCWLCLRTFSCGDDVYDHIPYCDHDS